MILPQFVSYVRKYEAGEKERQTNRVSRIRSALKFSNTGNTKSIFKYVFIENETFFSKRGPGWIVSRAVDVLRSDKCQPNIHVLNLTVCCFDVGEC